MKPEEALKIVDQVCASASLNRGVHVQIQQAIAVLTEAIKPKKDKDKKDKKDK